MKRLVMAAALALASAVGVNSTTTKADFVTEPIATAYEYDPCNATSCHFLGKSAERPIAEQMLPARQLGIVWDEDIVQMIVDGHVVWAVRSDVKGDSGGACPARNNHRCIGPDPPTTIQMVF